MSELAAQLGEFAVDDRIVIEEAPANNGVFTVWAGTRQPAWRYTAATLSFDSAGGGLWEVRDSANGLGWLAKNDWVRVSGSEHNDTVLRVETAGDDGSYFRCWQPLTTEAAGRPVTIVRGHAIRVREALVDESPSAAVVTLRAYGQKAAQGFQVLATWAAGG